MWTEEQFEQYRKESTAFETTVENILGDDSLRDCVRNVCSNLRNNSYRFRIVLADATDFKIEDEHNISFHIRRSDNLLTVSVCDGCTNIFVEYISLRKWNLPDRFIDHGDQSRLLADCGLDAHGIQRSIEAHLKVLDAAR